MPQEMSRTASEALDTVELIIQQLQLADQLQTTPTPQRPNSASHHVPKSALRKGLFKSPKKRVRISSPNSSHNTDRSPSSTSPELKRREFIKALQPQFDLYLSEDDHDDDRYVHLQSTGLLSASLPVSPTQLKDTIEDIHRLRQEYESPKPQTPSDERTSKRNARVKAWVPAGAPMSLSESLKTKQRRSRPHS
ncbi:hypothetical protein PROFUN_01284 [Planoprotostelium fungivorum]|uniref:Uncharacterized protein n=1 Tax=Planoprotostelium fungivorum TaxID=1890364 RepID=A0A2P6NZN9_9EUKA|nr:hypothetical protein PROFUN_01284 [Planoprotostelium fungivorum]